MSGSIWIERKTAQTLQVRAAFDFTAKTYIVIRYWKYFTMFCPNRKAQKKPVALQLRPTCIGYLSA
jgi:hypothetical protein